MEDSFYREVLDHQEQRIRRLEQKVNTYKMIIGWIKNNPDTCNKVLSKSFKKMAKKVLKERGKQCSGDRGVSEKEGKT